ncbi:MAG TPA: cytochrome c [Vicinamibacterales bacterium]|nr:cytochrome c [Vicinamibacterales bacterium]
MTALLAGCDSAPGRRAVETENIAPDKILDFNVLYRSNCAGCHGSDGRGGAATPLADPIYLGIAGDDVIRRATADGIAGTPMPPFARRSGGMLTDEQIDAIVKGIRTRWANASAVAKIELPPYSDSQPGEARRGGEVFAAYCASCHGAGGRGAKAGSSIVDASYLALVSDQGLRTTVIAGRPDLGAPDWRGNVRGTPMTPQDISDVVAWLSAQRPARGAP